MIELMKAKGTYPTANGLKNTLYIVKEALNFRGRDVIQLGLLGVNCDTSSQGNGYWCVFCSYAAVTCS